MKGLILVVVLSVLGIQASAAEETNELENIRESLVQVLVSKGSGAVDKWGVGVVAKDDGVILTSYSLVNAAENVQVRLSNGEVFDRVSLLGIDKRRNIASLKIQAIDLKPIQFKKTAFDPQEGFAVSLNSKGKPESNQLSVLRTSLADTLKNAGTGYQIIPIRTQVSGTARNGGVVTDGNLSVLGFIKPYERYYPRYGIPFSSILGLAEETKVSHQFGSGEALQFLAKENSSPVVEKINKTNPNEVLRDAKLFYVYSNSFYIKARMMENALMRKTPFSTGKLKIIRKRKNADIVINVEHKLFTWDYRYTVMDRRTNIVLASEKVTVLDGKAASKKFAKKLLKILREKKNPAVVATNTAGKNK